MPRSRTCFLIALAVLALWGCEVLVKETFRSIREDASGANPHATDDAPESTKTSVEFRTSAPELRTLDETTERVIIPPAVSEVEPLVVPRVTINGGTR